MSLSLMEKSRLFFIEARVPLNAFCSVLKTNGSGKHRVEKEVNLAPFCFNYCTSDGSHKEKTRSIGRNLSI